MIGNALLATSVIFLALGFWLLQECQFLIPYRHLLWVKYSGTIALFAAVALTVDLVDLLFRFVMLGSPKKPKGPGEGPCGRFEG